MGVPPGVDTQLDGIEVVLVVDAQLSGEEIASVEQAVSFATELDQVAGLLGLSAEAVTDYNGDGRLLVVSATLVLLSDTLVGSIQRIRAERR